MKTILVVDGGGRGFCLVDKYLRSKWVGKVLAVPGNDLMKTLSKNVFTFKNLKTTSVKEILEIAQKHRVDLVDVAQDNAIEAGLVNELNKNNIPVVGPTKEVGQIEWDKAYSREFMKRYDIPHPKFRVCSSQKEGADIVKKNSKGRWFIKAAGLAEGKGALAAKDKSEAIEKIKRMKKFGESGKTFLIEEWLEGEEFSAFSLCSGSSFKILGFAQDYKRVFNFDLGENTGGMGCGSRPSAVTQDIKIQVKEIFKKTLDGLKKEERSYSGILYLGGMIVKGKVYVLEFNARWGDPEAEVILPGIKNDLYDLSTAVLEQKINKVNLKTDDKYRVVVAGCSRGYPGDYTKVLGKRIFGLEKVSKIPGVKLFGAGVKVSGRKFLALGGRLFFIVGEGKDVMEARTKAYGAMSLISIEGNNLHFRNDIGWRDVQRFKEN